MNTAYPFSFSAHLSARSFTTHRTLWNTKLKVTWYFKHSTAGYSRGIEENSILAEWIFKLPFFLEVQLVPFSPDYHALPKNQSKEKSMSARINWQIQKRKRNHTKLLSFKMSHSLLVWLASTPRLLILYNQLAQTSSEDTRNSIAFPGDVNYPNPPGSMATLDGPGQTYIPSLSPWLASRVMRRN